MYEDGEEVLIMCGGPFVSGTVIHDLEDGGARTKHICNNGLEHKARTDYCNIRPIIDFDKEYQAAVELFGEDYFA
jgi:hypothetical protein